MKSKPMNISLVIMTNKAIIICLYYLEFFKNVNSDLIYLHIGLNT